jgi:drug/metabolite transporter (DMT)-like permease
LIAAVFTPWIACGIMLLIGFFASYLTALSWADLTFVLPATAFGNVIVALLSRFWLHEPISLERWAGIILITLGVGFVAQGPSLTERPEKPVVDGSGSAPRVIDASAGEEWAGQAAAVEDAAMDAVGQEQPR